MIQWDAKQKILTIQNLDQPCWHAFDQLFKRRLVNEHDHIAKQNWTINWLEKQIKQYFDEHNFHYYHWYIEHRAVHKDGNLYLYFVMIIENKDAAPNFLFSHMWIDNSCSCFYWDDLPHIHDFDWIDNFEYLVFKEVSDKSKPINDIGDAMELWERENGF